MKKLLFAILIALTSLTLSAQTEQQLIKTYGGIPTSNENMKWVNTNTPTETYEGVISFDTTINSPQIIEAFMITFQPLQDANLLTKQMRTTNIIGSTTATMSGDYESADEFNSTGDAESRRQYQIRSSWTTQFIDGVRLTRFYYNVSVQVKKGRYKLVVTPGGVSGYSVDHIQTEWSALFKNGEIKGMYAKYYDQTKIKLAYTIDQWIDNVDDNITTSTDSGW